MKVVSDILKFLTSLVAIATLYYLGIRYQNHQAIDDCMQNSSHQVTNIDKSISRYPIKDIYTYCLLDKGLKSNWK